MCGGGDERERETGGGLVKWIDLNGRFSVNLESGFPKKKKRKKAGIQSAEGLAGLPRNPHCALQRLVPAVDGAPRAAGSVTQIFTRPASGDIRAQTSQFSTAAEF